MTHYLAELYSQNPHGWRSTRTAASSFDAIGAGMGALSALGVEAIALGETDAATLHAPSQTFFAIWRAPDAKTMAL
jgi:hypothetical protein